MSRLDTVSNGDGGTHSYYYKFGVVFGMSCLVWAACDLSVDIFRCVMRVERCLQGVSPTISVYQSSCALAQVVLPASAEGNPRQAKWRLSSAIPTSNKNHMMLPTMAGSKTRRGRTKKRMVPSGAVAQRSREGAQNVAHFIYDAEILPGLM